MCREKIDPYIHLGAMFLVPLVLKSLLEEARGAIIFAPECRAKLGRKTTCKCLIKVAG